MLRPSYRELAVSFLRLGTTAFGGPAAHIAMMKAEFVDRRQWLTAAEFLDLVGASNLIPGPTSTEVALHIGLRRERWPGLLIAGACFILPAAALVTVIAWAYARYGRLPEALGVLYGIKPVIIAVVAQALWTMGRGALKSRPLAGLALAALACAFCRISPLVLIFGAGILAAGARWLSQPTPRPLRPLLGLAAVLCVLVIPPFAVAALQPLIAKKPGPWSLFLVFLKIGSVLYGSGYVLLAFLRTDLVSRLHWLTNQQILDAVAVGQFTPGPVFTTATFIGYLVAGVPGAAAATAGIFLPAFLLVGASRPLVTRLRASPIAASFLDGVNAASVAVMAWVGWQLGRAAILDWLTAALALGSAVVLLRFRINSVWLVLAGALIGSAAVALRHVGG